jgi:peroxiredoxin
MRGESDQIKVGDRAPAFALEAATGETLTLDSLHGHPVALYFFRGTW